MKAGWRRASRAHPCPVCQRPDGKEHNSTWCIHSTDGTVAICPFTSDGATKYLVDSGYLHRLNGTLCQTSSNPLDKIDNLSDNGNGHGRVRNWVALTQHFQKALTPALLTMLATKLLPERQQAEERALVALGVGWDVKHERWTFPMTVEDKVVGIRTRNGREKKSVAGSKTGLFVPATYRCNQPCWCCEGESDTAAMLTVGWNAIGRPAMLDGERAIRRLGHQAAMVVVGDNSPGERVGAATFAKRLGLPLIFPPEQYKDAREAIRAGCLPNQWT